MADSTMGNLSIEDLAAQMELEVPGGEERITSVLKLLNAMRTAEWLSDFFAVYLGRLQQLVPADNSPTLESADRLFADLEETSDCQIAAFQHFIEHANKSPDIAIDGDAQVVHLEEVLVLLKAWHEADAQVLALLEHGFMFFGLPYVAGSIRLTAAEVRRKRLLEVSQIVAQQPWTAVYLKDYLWERKESTFSNQQDANPTSLVSPKPDQVDCAICSLKLTEDPDHDPAEEDPMPTDGTVPNPPQFVCHTCRHPFHGKCSLRWFAKQVEGSQQCPMCRSLPDRATILATYQQEIARLDTWTELFAVITGKNATPAPTDSN
jgi:hypothetical protein